MVAEIKESFIRVVILSIDGIYSQIYDEIYCNENRYNEILSEFDNSDKYKVVKI